MSFVLFVEPEEVNASRISAILDNLDKAFEYRLVSTAADAIDAVEERKPDVFVGDMQIPIMSAPELFSLVEMMSPDTVRIVMTDGGKVSETVAFMNECRIYKIVLKPCRVADDLIGPIEAALEYKQMREQASMESHAESEQRRSLSREYKSASEAWQGQLQAYQRAQDSFSQMIGENVALAGFDETVRERVKRWYAYILDEYSKDVLNGLWDYPRAERMLLAFGNAPAHGFRFAIKSASAKIEPACMNAIVFILRVVIGVCKDLQNSYQLQALIEASPKAYVLRILYRVERDESGGESARAMRIKNPALRDALVKATKIGIASLGYKDAVADKNGATLVSILIPR